MGSRWHRKARWSVTFLLFHYSSPLPPADPHWAIPIKNYVRHHNQARAVNQVVNAFQDRFYPQLHVVNGLSTPTSSSLTTAAKENVVLSFDGLPPRPTAGSTLRCGGLQPHPELNEDQDHPLSEQIVYRPRMISPSLTTLEKAVAARIYFENLYFPLLRQPNFREQRRLAMERDMAQMSLSPEQKHHLRQRWRQNESDHLRERRQKLSASAFVKLKTIGHGTYSLIRHSPSHSIPKVPLASFPSSETNPMGICTL